MFEEASKAVAENTGAWFFIRRSKFKIRFVDEAFKLAVRERTTMGLISIDDFCELLAEHIVIDWADVKDPNGQDLAYTKPLCKLALLQNDVLLNSVTKIAFNSDQFFVQVH